MKIIRKSDGIVIDYIADHEVKENTTMVSLEQIRDCLSNRIAPYTDPNSVIASVEQIMNQLKEDLK